LKKPVTPSVDKIFEAQSMVPLYFLYDGAFPLSIISLLLMVSRGYAKVYDEDVTN
jgi:hypothetical protein